MSQQLINQLRNQRKSWVELDDGKRVQIIRPTEVQLSQSFIKAGEVSVGYDQVAEFVVDWQGFTEAALLGAGVGASDPLPFTSALWAEVASDNAAWVRTIAQALLDVAVAHSQKIDDNLKNSQPS